MTINYIEVLVAGITAMVVGFLWYEPLFGKLWIKLSKFSKEDMDKSKEKGMGKNYFIAFLAALVTAYVLAHFANFVLAITLGDALSLAFWVWLGFFAATAVSTVLWEGKSWKLFFLNIAYQLVMLVVMSSIIVLI